ncbi:MAG TPA: bifunctional homocysteine S-methyltransferase/methylenetetrahydrofolate reductase [Candidatus Polarisedimenticolia bacterium]|jgi:homocysteine S-methyltransferase|nr:bifunctional homocysteine S-methyltransferase/methylenetetrahydrofolate reductase [Candidatus Polarisedimenticolia bacterium]
MDSGSSSRARPNILEYLKDHVVVFDGGMGTVLYQKGVFLNRCFDELNLSAPDLVRDVHRAYLQAGADAVETNTFGANRYKLRGFQFEDKLREINRLGAVLAREAVGDRAWVAGSIGPLGLRIEPWGPTSVEEAEQAFREQAEALLEGGVDLFILETFTDLNEIHQGIKAIRSLGNLPLICQMTLEEDGNSLYGTAPEVFTKRLDEWGADVVGINCSVGPQVMLESLERMVKITSRPLSVQPNAGKPRAVDGRNLYLCSPEYMASYARKFILAGAQVVGGCCGTTPDHIKAIKSSIRALRPAHAAVEVSLPPEQRAEIEPVERARKSKVAAKLVEGRLVTCVEITPPKGYDTSKVVAGARILKAAGVDAINIPDGPRASARMGAQALALILENQVGIETILHYCCRDRNLLGMQSDLLGAAALGLKNLLVITGDPPKMGDYPDATAVFDVDAIGLTNVVSRLNQGLDLGGNSFSPPTAFLVGVGANPGALEIDHEIRRFQYKVEAGAEFAITQPVFDVRQLRDFLGRIERFRIPIIAGIWPLTSLRNAEFMNNEVPGVHVAEEIMERMRKAEGEGKAREEGISIARETVNQVKDLVQGVQVSAPFGRYQAALDVLDGIIPRAA